LTLIEKAEEVYEKEEAEEAAAKLLEGQFTLEDFLDQMQQVKKMGPLSGLVKMLPGVPKELRDQEIDDRELAKVEAMIYSMTVEERRHPDRIDASRRARIAAGSGTQAQDVSQLLTQFKEMQKLMKRMGGLGSKKVKKGRKDKRGKGGGRPAAGGGRVTPKGGRTSGRVTPKGGAPLTLPNLDTGGLGPDGPGGLPDLDGIDLEALGLDPDALGIGPDDLPRRR
ncbi:MAG: hypothetical protein U0Q07_19730, partial [Acidimicrobiales bacterium]